MLLEANSEAPIVIVVILGFTKVATATVTIPETIFGGKGSERILAFSSAASAPASAFTFDTALASSWIGLV